MDDGVGHRLGDREAQVVEDGFRDAARARELDR